MSDGAIYYACRDGHYVLKFFGDVRLTLCSTIERHLDSVLERDNITDSLVDLTETDNIDSTSLGLIAKLAIKAEKKGMPKPTLVSTSEDITRVLLSMGFDQVFVLVPELPSDRCELKQVPFVQESEEEVRARILDAHKVLSELNDSNREAFKDLVATLENCH
ncbi:STAS domain-containing protein [Marinobacterium sp. AK62]|uniref:STAS domain-containing protein n=1 Tax=Marinobacterium alkalitolerans TaxID=1542925 RepID=A0ABS3ZCQ3_9GAMM|nr:STAS domain-containing protein [Marinobacterium alkalitolerans]MBP0049480.1 STAS domain-containing protein [Marinobacterium alkalitolerans]